MLLKILLSLAIMSANAAFDHNHKDLDKILEQFLVQNDKQTAINYKKLKQSPQKLMVYLKKLSLVSKDEYNKFSNDQKLAFLINAYNAYTLKLIIDHYPIASIKKLGSFFTSAWKIKFFTLLQEETHLDHIEHGIIRKHFNEPRIHFAVNCASIGCPSLYKEAFKAKSLDTQLEQVTKNFLNNKNKNKIKNETLYLSKIFDWYGEDFVKKHGSIQNFLKIYWGDIALNKKIKFLDYDWGLNDAK